MIAVLLIAYDVIAINMAYFLALWFRFDCIFSKIPQNYYDSYLKFAPI